MWEPPITVAGVDGVSESDEEAAVVDDPEDEKGDH